MTERKLVPVFIPPLAALLGAAQKQRGGDLTTQEVTQIRDRAACIMMEPADAKALEASRGFRDVEPEDVWADWHRLKVQVTGHGYLPRIVLCLVGDARFAAQAEALLRSEKIEHEVRGADPRMLRSFEAAACRVEPSFAESDRVAVATHTNAVYVLSANFTAGAAIATARAMLAVGARLLEECSGAAMKCESSGIAHGKAKWLELARASARPDVVEATRAAVRAFVQFPIGDRERLWTCGMHLLGRPDLIADRAVLRDDFEVARLFDTFCIYLLAECGEERHFASGNTFQCDAASPRFRATWEPCQGYDEDEFFFNPFGRYRFADLPVTP